MNPNQVNAPPTGIKLGDILYVIFRHKWKIILISFLGLALAAGLYFLWPLPYESHANLFIKYVLDTRTPTVGPNEANKVKVVDDRGETVMSTELAILHSFDLAKKVADKISPATRKLVEPGGEPIKVAKAIFDGLSAEAPRKGSVIELTFKHANREVVSLVLNQVILSYKELHKDIHGTTSKDPLDNPLRNLSREAGRALENTETNLANEKLQIGVTSLEDAKKVYTEQLSKIQEAIFAARAELEYKQAVLSNLTHGATVAQERGNGQLTSTNEAPEMTPAPQDAVTEYKRILAQLDQLLKREQEMLVMFTPSSAMVKSAREQIEAADKKRQDLEQRYPSLVGIKPAGSGPMLTSGRTIDIETERAEVSGLQSRIMALGRQYAAMTNETARLANAEPRISRLERQKEMEAANYKLLDTSYQQSLINKELEPGTVSNISTVQEPSPAGRDVGKLMKIALGIAVGSIAFAFALAFLIDFYLDQSIKRPTDVETRLGLPLFISIPEMRLNGNGTPRGLLGTGSGQPLLAEKSGDSSAAEPGHEPAPGEATTGVARSNRGPTLEPFYEALRDRLMTFFEAKNLTHKPKLVALTSCGEGSGVSTVAAGLAASLSETGDGNVLLVDMNVQDGAAQRFHRGDIDYGIDEALESVKREDARVQENLYVVQEAGKAENLPSILPKRFKSLVPKLKASDYDYIIFDMPPVSQISLTPRLARFMDSVLMVVEAEKTDRELVKRATTLLAESKTNVGIVLNKGHTYLPKKLVQDL